MGWGVGQQPRTQAHKPRPAPAAARRGSRGRCGSVQGRHLLWPTGWEGGKAAWEGVPGLKEEGC